MHAKSSTTIQFFIPNNPEDFGKKIVYVKNSKIAFNK